MKEDMTEGGLHLHVMWHQAWIFSKRNLPGAALRSRALKVDLEVLHQHKVDRRRFGHKQRLRNAAKLDGIRHRTNTGFGSPHRFHIFL